MDCLGPRHRGLGAVPTPGSGPLAEVGGGLFQFTVPEGIIAWREVAPLAAGFRNLQLQISSDQLHGMHPADLADIVADLGHRERQQLLASMTIEKTADLLEERAVHAAGDSR